jgi:hypothetical protein
MKAHQNDILHRLDEVDRALSLLVTYAEADVDWSAVPNYKRLIVLEKIEAIETAISLMYSHLEFHTK